MRTLDRLLAEYGQSHQHPTNKRIHWVCVPLIFFSMMGLISHIPAPHIGIPNLFLLSLISLLAIILVSIFYLRLSKVIFLFMLFLMGLFQWIVFRINLGMGRSSWILYLGIFIVTWIFQFWGHRMEGKKPSFLKDLQFLLVGPAWLLHFILKKIGIRY